MEEIWKPIAGYEGLYEVSNMGRVKSLNYNRTGKEKILCPGVSKTGYLYVNLWKNGKRKNYRVHRLVAQAFLENPENLPEVNHKNQVKTDNSIFNIEWCSRKYNVRYSQAKKVGQYKDGKLIKVYNAIQDVKNDGFHDGHVCSALKGKLKSHGSYQWKYLD